MLYAHQKFPGVQRVTVAGYRRPQSARVRSIYAKQGVDGIEESCIELPLAPSCQVFPTESGNSQLDYWGWILLDLVGITLW